MEEAMISATYRTAVVMICAAVLIWSGLLRGQAKQLRDSPRNLPVQAGLDPKAHQAMVVEQGRQGLSPNTPVVTVDGVCSHPEKVGPANSCKTVITRAQMDSLIDALEPNAPALARRQFAINYVRLLAASGVAERRHLDKDPEVTNELQIQEKIVRMQVLANTLFRRLQLQASNVPSTDIEKYYVEHHANYEQGLVRRLLIPKAIAPTNPDTADVASPRAKADQLRARAAAGEDFDQLQQSAYKDLELKEAANSVKPSPLRRSNLPPSEQSVFDLKLGEVSPVIESQDAFLILKLESKEFIPMEEARPEILSLLQRQQKQQGLRDVTESAKTHFNPAYLDMPTAPDLFPPPVLTPLGTQSNKRAGRSARRWTARSRGAAATRRPY